MKLRAWAAVAILILAVACGGDSEGAEAFCDAARELATGDPSDAQHTLDTFERMRAEAPDEISDAINTLVDATKEAIENQDRSVIESQEFQDASDELDSYLEGNCEAPE